MNEENEAYFKRVAVNERKIFTICESQNGVKFGIGISCRETIIVNRIITYACINKIQCQYNDYPANEGLAPALQ